MGAVFAPGPSLRGPFELVEATIAADRGGVVCGGRGRIMVPGGKRTTRASRFIPGDVEGASCRVNCSLFEARGRPSTVARRAVQGDARVGRPDDATERTCRGRGSCVGSRP